MCCRNTTGLVTGLWFEYQPQLCWLLLSIATVLICFSWAKLAHQEGRKLGLTVLHGGAACKTMNDGLAHGVRLHILTPATKFLTLWIFFQKFAFEAIFIHFTYQWKYIFLNTIHPISHSWFIDTTWHNDCYCWVRIFLYLLFR